MPQHLLLRQVVALVQIYLLELQLLQVRPSRPREHLDKLTQLVLPSESYVAKHELLEAVDLPLEGWLLVVHLHELGQLRHRCLAHLIVGVLDGLDAWIEVLGVQNGVQDHRELLILHVAVVQMDAEQVVLCLDIAPDHRRERLTIAEAEWLAQEVHGVVVEAFEDRESQKALRLAVHEELGLLGGWLVVAGDLLLGLVVESVVCLDAVEEILLVERLIRLV